MQFTKIYIVSVIMIGIAVAAALSPMDGQPDRSLRGKKSNKCGKIDQCYFLNNDTGKKVSLSKSGAMAMDSPTSRHTILCNTKGNIDEVTFEYDGQHKHVESVKPWSMAGDMKDMKHNNVPYLTTPGEKEIKITGKLDNNVCFEETFSYTVYSDMSNVPAQHRNLARVYILDFGVAVVIIVFH